MTSRRQRSRAQHRLEIAGREAQRQVDRSDRAARRQVAAAVADMPTRTPLPEHMSLVPVRDDARLVLHYRGDRTAVHTRQVFGPDMHGALYRPTGATYDAASDVTTMSFRPVTAGADQ